MSEILRKFVGDVYHKIARSLVCKDTGFSQDFALDY